MSPQGAPESETLFRILEVLFSEKEAELASQLPMDMFTIKKAAKIWQRTESQAEKILDGLADKGILIDIKGKKKRRFIMAPTMAGFFEFSIMRTDGKFDRKLLSELFHKYINEEDLFFKMLFSLDPAVVRTFVHEDTIAHQKKIEVLDYERATHVIDSATCITVGSCYCRHKMEHMGKACDKPQEVCLTFNTCAESLAKHGIAKKISKQKAHKILKMCIDEGLVQIGDNVQNSVAFICNCCGCCCEALLGYKRLGCAPEISSNFKAVVDRKHCKGCGICAKKCPVDAIEIRDKKAYIDIDKCIGCGVCTGVCPTKGIQMHQRKERVFVPHDSFERFVMEAINEGKLPNLIFDNRNLWTHNMMRRLLAIILALPPAKQLLAKRQLQSRFINNITKIYKKFADDHKVAAGKTLS
jgi:Pyruvate/2-oxoacid:ferredoxin oxidoreductase delta subunit